jgi:hypothetical protein
VELVQAFAPLVPAITTHEKIVLGAFVVAEKVVPLPIVVSVTVTVAPVVVVEKPTDVWQVVLSAL